MPWAQSWHHGVQPLAAPKGSRCLTSAGAGGHCGVSWACLVNTKLGDPGEQKLAMQAPGPPPAAWPLQSQWQVAEGTSLSWLPCCGDSLQPGQRGAGAVELGTLISSENWGKWVADQVRPSLNLASSHGTPMLPPSCHALCWGQEHQAIFKYFQLQGKFSPGRASRYWREQTSSLECIKIRKNKAPACQVFLLTESNCLGLGASFI